MDLLTQLTSAYKRMAHEARYRPAAPSDGMGNIVVPLDQLDLNSEAVQYAKTWYAEEEGQVYRIGCPDFSHRPALMFAVEGARLACGSVVWQNKVASATLLRMAADELDPPSPGTSVFYSPEEFAQMMGVNPRTVRKWAREGKIASIKIGSLVRIPATALSTREAS